ncbi:pantetheine-phosphate adenylyltransferase [Lacticaseibacillus hulanensis]|uniref:pantetheine-phosphate adenylyltransferase n=1 Tax=Lacticaseibacillus hulanensis TaxID=2493111 RepID=UPI000FD9D921|nr:pantetheine-phosphate adenylyltransferase [Lacticaseibacillus hulanensis]
MTRIGIFPGSFDPFTLGHLATVRQGLRLVDELVVAVMTNTGKTSLFTAEERVAQIKVATADLTGVRVVAAPQMLTVAFAKQVGAQVIIRGLRDAADYTFENSIAVANAKMAPDITTVLLPADANNVGTSSSIVKEIAAFGGDLTPFVPANVSAALRQKFGDGM